MNTNKRMNNRNAQIGNADENIGLTIILAGLFSVSILLEGSPFEALRIAGIILMFGSLLVGMWKLTNDKKE